MEIIEDGASTRAAAPAALVATVKDRGKRGLQSLQIRALCPQRPNVRLDHRACGNAGSCRSFGRGQQIPDLRNAQYEIARAG